jgi:uncharacterized membrane protein HdeD (DUF308 family)
MPVPLTPHWWALALRGLLAVLFGIACLVAPVFIFELLIIFYGAYAFVDGIFAIAAAAFGEGQAGRWWALLIEGILGVVVGAITFLWPGITAVALLYLIAFWAIAHGVFEIIAAIRLRAHIQGEWALVLGGILSVIFGVLVLVWPGGMVLTIMWVIGIYAVLFGILLFVLAFRVWKWGQQAATLTNP